MLAVLQITLGAAAIAAIGRQWTGVPVPPLPLATETEAEFYTDDPSQAEADWDIVLRDLAVRQGRPSWAASEEEELGPPQPPPTRLPSGDGGQVPPEPTMGVGHSLHTEAPHWELAERPERRSRVASEEEEQHPPPPPPPLPGHGFTVSVAMAAAFGGI